MNFIVLALASHRIISIRAGDFNSEGVWESSWSLFLVSPGQKYTFWLAYAKKYYKIYMPINDYHWNIFYNYLDYFVLHMRFEICFNFWFLLFGVPGTFKLGNMKIYDFHFQLN